MKTYAIVTFCMLAALVAVPAASASPPTCGSPHPDDHALIGLVTCQGDALAQEVAGCAQLDIYIYERDGATYMEWRNCETFA